MDDPISTSNIFNKYVILLMVISLKCDIVMGEYKNKVLS